MKADEKGRRRRPEKEAPRKVGSHAAEPDPVQMDSVQGCFYDKGKEVSAQICGYEAAIAELEEYCSKFGKVGRDYLTRACVEAGSGVEPVIHISDECKAGKLRMRLVLVEGPSRPDQRAWVLAMMKFREVVEQLNALNAEEGNR